MTDEAPSKWTKFWTGTEPEQAAAPTSVMTGQSQAAPETKAPAQPMDRTETTGVWLAVLVPVVGILYGLALVARGGSRYASNLVVWSVVSYLVWAVVLGVIYGVLIAT